MTARTTRRWSWYGQTLDIVLAAAGLTIIGAMVVRWSFPVGGILLALSCVGSISASQVIDVLVGRWTKQSNGSGS